MKPTVGRIVHFRDESYEQKTHAAMVVAVSDDPEFVNVKIFRPEGGEAFKRDCRRGDGDQQWNWPPRDEERPKAPPVPPVS